MGKNRRTMLSSCPQMALAEAIFEYLMGVTYCSFAWRVFIVAGMLKARGEEMERVGGFLGVKRDRIC